MSVITCSSNGDWQCSREYGIVVSSRSSSTSSNVFAINLRSTMFIPSRVRLERSCATRYLHALLWDRILMEFWTTSFIRRPHGQMACPQLSLVEKTLKTGMRQMDKLGFRTGKGFFLFVLVIEASNLRWNCSMIDKRLLILSLIIGTFLEISPNSLFFFVSLYGRASSKSFKWITLFRFSAIKCATVYTCRQPLKTVGVWTLLFCDLVLSYASMHQVSLSQ